MKILKRITAILFIFFFLLTPVGLNMACPVPTYAADEWEDVTKADLVTAFKYYCKSRNLAIEGSLADALTTFTTDTFNNLVNTLGIDSDAIQAELKKTTQGNLGLRFLFTQTGINFYNRLFAEFLQNNDLAVGDDVDNKVLFSGQGISLDGKYCFIWLLSSQPNGGVAVYPSLVINEGSFIDDGLFFKNLYDNGIRSYAYSFSDSKNITFASNIYRYGGYPVYGNYSGGVINKSGTILYRISNDTNLYLGVDWEYSNNSDYYRGLAFLKQLSIDDDSENVDITATTNNTTINNNDYSKDYTIIYNDGDYYDIDNIYPSPDTPPDSGGGGGGDNPDTPTPPSSTTPDWDIELPDTDIDWIISGMEERFPWDIPFNVMFALSLLNAEPETPHFEGTIDLKVVEWNYDIDLEPFDEIAGYFRKFFFLGFLVWLLLVTKKLIWG